MAVPLRSSDSKDVSMATAATAASLKPQCATLSDVSRAASGAVVGAGTPAAHSQPQSRVESCARLGSAATSARMPGAAALPL